MPLISKHIIRKIESELYSYPTKLKEINEQRNDILYGTILPDVMVSGGQIGNTTQSKAIRLAQIEGDWVNLIRDALARMPNEYRWVAKGIYFDHKQIKKVADELYISLRLCYVWKESLLVYITLMATEKDLIKPFSENA